MNTSFPKALRLLSYAAVWVGAAVACIQPGGIQPAYAIAATVAGAAVLQIAASLLEGRRHE